MAKPTIKKLALCVGLGLAAGGLWSAIEFVAFNQQNALHLILQVVVIGLTGLFIGIATPKE